MYSELMRLLELRSSELSHHLKVLRDVKIVQKRENGGYALTTKGRLLLLYMQPPSFVITFFRWLDSHPHVIIPPPLCHILLHDADKHQLISGGYVLHEVFLQVQQHVSQSLRMFFLDPIWHDDLVIAANLMTLSHKVTITTITASNDEKRITAENIQFKVLNKSILHKVLLHTGGFIIMDETLLFYFMCDQYGHVLPSAAIKSTSQQFIRYCLQQFDRAIQFAS